jgi:beta-phosphoglucomutase-like phosphatase (HAD superfamily)
LELNDNFYWGDVRFCSLFPGLPQLFVDLRKQGHRLLHTTDYTRYQLTPVLDFWEREYDYVPDVVACSDEVGPEHQFTSMIELALHKLEHTNNWLGLEQEKARTIKVDDTAHGVLAGLNAGIWASCAVVEHGAWRFAFRKQEEEPEEVDKQDDDLRAQMDKLYRLTPHVYSTTSACIAHMRDRDPRPVNLTNLK